MLLIAHRDVAFLLLLIQNFFIIYRTPDFRQKIPRYCPPYLDHNLSKRRALEEISRTKKIPLSTLTLAWIVDKGKRHGFTLMPFLPVLIGLNWKRIDRH